MHRFAAVVSSIRRGRDLDAPDSPLAFSRQEVRTMQYNLRNVHGLNASTAKHLLMRLTDAKSGRPESALLPNKMTVEHVLPKKLGAGSPWRTWFSDPTEREQCTDCLGNLVLVTKDQNDRASNLGFARKLDVYFNSPGEPIPGINTDLRGRNEWRARDIRRREADLFQLIEMLWQFGIATPSAQAAE
ncbi:MAG TPA: HNH endonuclease family protein [Hyphomicrobiaceae bacterium]|nr:HNH endonuclease family protein [Hyphomicrobiaceae bacterium]